MKITLPDPEAADTIADALTRYAGELRRTAEASGLVRNPGAMWSRALVDLVQTGALAMREEADYLDHLAGVIDEQVKAAQ